MAGCIKSLYLRDSSFFTLNTNEFLCNLPTAQASFCHSRITGFSSVQHEKLRPTDILVRRLSCLELTAKTSATNYFIWPFQSLTQDLFIRADIAFSALETSIYLFNGPYKFIYSLTYLFTYVLIMEQLRHQIKMRLCLVDRTILRQSYYR